MKAITLRNIPPEVQKGIRERARRKRISANRAVIELLQERLAVPRREKDGLYHDLDHLFGSWTAEQALYHDLDHLFGSWTAEQADEFSRWLMETREAQKQFFGK